MHVRLLTLAYHVNKIVRFNDMMTKKNINISDVIEIFKILMIKIKRIRIVQLLFLFKQSS